MQLIETYTSAKGIPILFVYKTISYLQRQNEPMRNKVNFPRSISNWVDNKILKKPTGKTWGDLCS